METNEIKFEIKLLTPEEASKKFFNGKKTYSAMVAAARKRQLPSIKVGNRIFFEENSLREFFAIQLAAAAAIVQSHPSQPQREKIKIKGIKRID